MYTYQRITLLICILVIILLMIQFKRKKISLSLCSIIDIIAILILIVTLYPQITVDIAKMLGLGRGLDMLYIIAILILLFTIFKLYNMIEDQKRRINELISQLALQENENK